jgi:DNA-binding LytR/AlgR family response regulator
VKSGQSLRYIPVEEAAYFYAEDGLNFLLTEDRKRFPIDYTLDQLESELDPARFYRISRKFIVSLPAIHQIHPYFNHRLKLDLKPPFDGEVIVSRDRVPDFKAWLDK